MKKTISFIILLFTLLICFISCDNSCKHETLDVHVVAPTCTEKGYTENRCIDCGYSFMNQETDPLGHTLVSTVVEATCDTQGFIKNVCECGYEFLSNYVAPFGHDFTDTVIPAKCDTEGYTLHSCKSCDYSFSDEYVEAPGHTYIKYTVVPLCAKPGYTVYACACGFSYNSDYKAPLGHDLESKKVEPTCTAAGYTEYYCFCGYSYISDYVKPLDHNYTSTVTTDPTCITAGYTDYTCECGSTLRADYVDALGHVYSTEVTAPTCAEAGYTVNTCRCGDTYVSDIISATGHDFIKNKIMPTVSDMGYTEFTCKACDFKYTGNYSFYSEILPNGAYASGTTVLARGIDISKWNHPTTPQGDFLPLDWNGIKDAGIEYVILKAGSTIRDGKGGKETTFDIDYTAAHEAGLDVGVYFYTYATNVEQIKKDAELLLSILDGKSFEYPIYLDLEDDSLLDIEPSVLTEMCVTFFSILQKNGYYTGLYVNHEWLHNILQTEKMLDLFEIWYARYPQNVTEYVWDTTTYGEHLGMWQYTDKGQLSAIPETDIDFNFAYKDYPTLIKKLGLNNLE